MIDKNKIYSLLWLCALLLPHLIIAQGEGSLTIDRIFSGEFQMESFGPAKWLGEGEAYTTLESSASAENGRDIIQYSCKDNTRSVLVAAEKLIEEGSEDPMYIANYSWSNDGTKLLVFTNTRRVWRANTKGDYYVFDMKANRLKKLGEGLAASSLMFAKFSPDDQKVAYASRGNLYIEDLVTGAQQQLTEDGNKDIFNGTFDWAYEEEFACRDGFRWSADSRRLAFWQVDASEIRNFLMINNTDSLYSFTVPVQYPKVGEPPSKVRLGVVELASGTTNWLKIPSGDDWPYLPRMQWIANKNQLLVQQLNRKQNNNRLWLCDGATGEARNVYTESDPCWVDVTHPDPTMNWDMTDPHVLDKGKAVLWTSEKDGWRQLYRLDLKDGKTTLLTQGDYDIARMYQVNDRAGNIYFNASPENPTQRYLYQIPIKGSPRPSRLTPADQSGLHRYNISPNGKYAIHTWSNINTPTTIELVSLPKHKLIRTLVDNADYKAKVAKLEKGQTEFFKIKTIDGVEMDGVIRKPPGFDPQKKYPVLFNVYGEPWGQTATDSWGNPLWNTMMTQRGYIVITMDNRGTPSLKGREWRKSLYRKIGVLNSRDQAMATRELMKWSFIDSTRIAVWGWSGGGSMTLNLLFRYPEIYGTGVSVAPVANQLLYDNIYQERYMGVPWENKEDFVEGSPVTYAKNLKGNLMLIHGTADDNVHYQNAEDLINELILQNKQFSMMSYPNRSHGIYEGENTSRHLYQLISNYIQANTPVNSKESIIKP